MTTDRTSDQYLDGIMAKVRDAHAVSPEEAVSPAGETFDAEHARDEVGCGHNFQEPVETQDIPGHPWVMARHLCMKKLQHKGEHECSKPGCKRHWPNVSVSE